MKLARHGWWILTVLALIALSALSAPPAVKSRIERLAFQPPTPSALLAASAPAAPLTSRGQAATPQSTTLHPPTVNCVSAQAPILPPPSPPGPDSSAMAFDIVHEGDVVRLVPMGGPPVLPTRRDDRGSLDQGMDGCPATLIPYVPYFDAGTMLQMLHQFAPSCSVELMLPDVVYRYTPESTRQHVLRLTTYSWPRSLSIRTGGACPGSREVVCADAGYSELEVVDTLYQDSTYFIIIDADTSFDWAYEFRMDAVSDCIPDAELTVPGTVSGNTCFAHDDCPLYQGDDQVVRITIPHNGTYRFGLCDGEQWEARLVLHANCCSGPALASNYYGCPWEPGNYFTRPRTPTLALNAGTYYLHIEPWGTSACGAWTLTAEEIPACTTRPANDDCDDLGPPATLPATFTGDNRCATHDADSLSNGQGETWHSFIMETPGDVLMDFCNVSTSFYSFYNMLTPSCAGTSWIRATETRYGGCGNYWSGIVFLFRNLAAGTYYYPMLRDSTYGNEGPYLIHIQRVPACSLTAQDGDIIECLDYPEGNRLGQDCNRGCVQPSGAFFQEITCGQSVHGRGFSYLNAQNRRTLDSDWFEFDLEDTGTVTVTITAEFPVTAYITDRQCGYQPSYAYASSVVPCSTLTLTTRVLRPHTYAINISPVWFMYPLDTVHYRFTLTCDPGAFPCDLSEEPGDVPVGEPVCHEGYVDSVNSGCDHWPEIFQDVECPIQLFGHNGVYRRGTGLYRDTDWFRFTTTQNSIISMTAIAEFDPYLVISNYCPGCEGGLAESSGYTCDTVRATTRCLPPGEYIAGIFPTDWTHLPCGSEYRTWISCEPCAPCVAINEPYDLLENEPPCTTWVNHPDNYNGGCNSYPPVFGPPLQCGQSLWGRSGTWYGNGMQRDTDWLTITLVENLTPQFCVVAQFPALTAIVGPGGNTGCDSVILYSELAIGASCDTLCVTPQQPLEPGTYWLFVAPNTFDNVLCGTEYHAWVNCDPCVPDTVTNLTIRGVGSDVVLRWTADPTFAGTFTIYYSPTDTPYGDPQWQILASNLAPQGSDRRMVYTHPGVLNAPDRQFYLIVSRCR